MENLMIKVIQQMKNDDNDVSQKEIDISSKKYVPESSDGTKSTDTDTKSRRTSAFSILRDNVLQYVEDGGWNSQTLQTTTRVPLNAQERKGAKKTSCSNTSGQDLSSQRRNSVSAFATASSCQLCPLQGGSREYGHPDTTTSRHGDLHLLPQCYPCIQCAKQSCSKCTNHKSPLCWCAGHLHNCGQYKDIMNFTTIRDCQSPDEMPTTSSDYLTSLQSIYVSPKKRSSPEDVISLHSVDGLTENKSSDSDVGDESNLQDGDANLSDSEGLSTYTLHNRWQEILPKEVIQQLSRDKDLNKKHLLQHVNKENILTDSTQYFTDSDRESDDADSFVLNDQNQNNDCNSELRWSTVSSIIVKESADEIENSFNIDECITAAKTSSSSIGDSGNSRDSPDEPPQKMNSIQDAYRSILKTVTNVSGATTSPYLGRKSRRLRKVKKKPKPQPVYTCPKCQSTYLVSSKRAIAISKCLKCDLWTSVNDVERDEDKEEEVSVSFCCLS